MAKFKINKEFRIKFSEKLMDLGNLVAIALVFGQFINGSREFSFEVFAVGILIVIVCYGISYMLYY